MLDTIRVELHSMSGYEIGLHRGWGDEPSKMIVQGSVDSEPRSYRVQKKTIDRLFEQAQQLCLPAAPSEPLMGCDGGTLELTFIAGMHQSTFSWWVEPPKGWEPLEAFANEIIKLAKRRVPPRTFELLGP